MKKKTIAAALIFQLALAVMGAVSSLIVTSGEPIRVFESGSIVYSVVVLVLLLIVAAIEVISVFKIHDSTAHTVLTAFAILLGYLFSYDFQQLLNPSRQYILDELAAHCGFLCFHLIVLSLVCLLNYLYKLGIKRAEGLVLCALSAADFALFAVLSRLDAEAWAYAAYLPVILYILIRLSLAAVKGGKTDLNFFLVTSILSAALGMQLNNFLYDAGALPFRVYGVDTTYVLIIVFMFAGVYVNFLMRTQRAALEAGEYKLQTEQLKTRMLREQINPHYIFNSLIAVKEAYHRDTASGDKAMNYFSRHLRANVEAMNLDCIPFAEELDNVENYIGLESLKRGKNVKIFYGVEADDFSLPVLSLQTFVENAVKYARTDEKEDGYIAISSVRESGGVKVEIVDNGVGFDVDNIKPSSCGIRNARERFALLLGADVKVESRIGKGTKVSILIPDGGCRVGQGEDK